MHVVVRNLKNKYFSDIHSIYKFCTDHKLKTAGFGLICMQTRLTLFLIRWSLMNRSAPSSIKDTIRTL